MTIIKLYLNHKGGINNLNVAQVRNNRLELLKGFTSVISMDKAEKRAIKYMNNL